MEFQCKQLPARSTGMRRSSSNAAIALLISVLILFAVNNLVHLSLAAPAETTPKAVTAGQNSSKGIHPLDVITHQVFLPLVSNNYPRLSTLGVQFYGALDAVHGFTRVVESQAGWVRFPVTWSTIEPTNTTPENYIWTSLDASAQAVQDANIAAIFTFESNPSWAAAKASGPVTNTADFTEFVGAIVARYPHIHYWEIYNEPDGSKSFGKKGAVYAALLAQAYPVIKAANPAANVVLGGLALDWFEDQGGPFDRNFLPDVLANCTGVCFDIANFHYYPFFRAQWESYGRDIIGKANYVRQVLASRNFVRPLFATETGWPSASSWGSEELAARYVPKVFARGLAAGLQATIWYAMFDSDASNPGLLDSVTMPGSLIPRSSYEAFRVAVQMLDGVRYVRTIIQTLPDSRPIEGYQFATLDGKRLDVYWYDCPSVALAPPQDCNDVAPLIIAATRIAKIDKLGNATILTDEDDGYQDGSITLGVLSSPIYIDYAP
jgi:hypothetical protein